MLRNYLLITWRNLRRNPLFLVLNIIGLSIGIAASLLIWQYVTHERSYDQFYAHQDQLYRVRLDRYNQGELGTEWAAGCAAVGPALVENFPEVDKVARMHSRAGVFTLNEKVFREEAVYAATPSIIEMFDLEVLSGDAKSGLERPLTMVITEKIARKYFGDADPIGKTIETSNSGEMEVVGVIKEFTQPTHFNIDIIYSFATLEKFWGEEIHTAWQWDGWYTYVQLKPGTDPLLLGDKLDEYVNVVEKEYLESANHRMDFSFVPINDIHLTSNLIGEFKPNGDKKTVKFLSIVGFLILIIAWINYINLSTARATDRGKEVGVRKTNGATKNQLIFQFLFDSLLINLIAAVIGLSIYQLAKPFLNSIAAIPQDYALWSAPWFFPIFIGVLLIGSLLSGLYPAWVLSSFNPINAIKGQFNLGVSKGRSLFTQVQLRRALVVFQFAASIILIAATFTIYRQLTFMQEQEKGMNLDQTIVLEGPSVSDSTYNQKMASYINGIKRIPGVKTVATSSTVPGKVFKLNAGGVRLWGADESEGRQYDRQFMNSEYLDLFDIDLAAGENFSNEAFKDSNYVIMNQAAVAYMGISSDQEAIGKQIHVWGDKLTVKGVIKDYFHRSLKEHPIPTLFLYYPYCRNYQSVKIEESALRAAIPAIQKEFERSFPGNPYEYFFADEQYGKLYTAEKTSGRIFALFSMLAVFVACLGLFGLISYALARRTKEIGIRKVLGASYQNILQLLLKDFSYLVLISGALAIPFTFWAISTWLKDYPYRIGINWELFLIPILVVMVLALLTILRSTIISAHAKPIESLRTE